MKTTKIFLFFFLLSCGLNVSLFFVSGYIFAKIIFFASSLALLFLLIIVAQIESEDEPVKPKISVPE